MLQQRIFRATILALLIIGLSLLDASAKSLRVGSVGLSGELLPLWVAQDKGLFKKNGLDTEVITFHKYPEFPKPRGELCPLKFEKEAYSMSIHRLTYLAFGVYLVFSFFVLPCPFAQAAASNQKIVIVFGDLSEKYGILFVARDQRFFEERGLEAEVVQVHSGPIAISALAAGDAHFYSAAASGSTLGAMAGGLDVVYIGGLINKLDGDFVVSPKIRNPSDLKGKILEIQSIGGGLWMFTLMALDHWGLDPKRDKIQ